MDQTKIIELIQNYINFLVDNHYNIKNAFLFGSYANDSNKEDSDIDLALVIEGLKNNYDEQLKLMKFRRNFDTRIEPHPFSPEDFNSDNPFVKEILTKGIKII